jgi:hypothetical protein
MSIELSLTFQTFCHKISKKTDNQKLLNIQFEMLRTSGGEGREIDEIIINQLPLLG